MTKAKASSKLTSLGDSAEAMLAAMLKDMGKDIKKPQEDRKYSLTDQCKVIDRVAKFESIRAKITDDEGSFFNEPEEEGENDDGNGTN